MYVCKENSKSHQLHEIDVFQSNKTRIDLSDVETYSVVIYQVRYAKACFEKQIRERKQF